MASHRFSRSECLMTHTMMRTTNGYINYADHAPKIDQAWSQEFHIRILP